MPSYPAAYQSTKGSALDVDRDFYQALADGERQLKQQYRVPIRSGFAWEVPAGHLFRITTPEGPQVGDLNIWNRHNPRERMWAARTRQLQRAHLSTFDRLWSNLPFLRPIATITADSLADYGIDEHGGRIHDLLGTRCDPYVNKLLTGEDFDFHCHSNLTRAVQPYGLTEFDVHDVLNVFQCTGLNAEDKYFMKSCRRRPVTTSNSSPKSICCARSPPVRAAICLWRCGATKRRTRCLFVARWALRSGGRTRRCWPTGGAGFAGLPR
ncbi:Urea carboxylase-related aminomethyltransferase [Klebsiella variicola]|uniref:Urea carboxylase-related aminomethyltransferase n=1 Tax=Klebsiella variicola TaxID=244366 RepID=A0A7H4N3Y8_KLEVA|nr:Urea carboxylase-related aminomethyltransferase [Klebsiella variicola]